MEDSLTLPRLHRWRVPLNESLAQSWARAWHGVGGKGHGEEIRDSLLARYSEPHRVYHTVRYLEECITAFSEVSSLAKHSAAVELALWFHDAVCDGNDSCEERSAELARTSMNAAGMSFTMIALVQSLILATRHTVSPVTADECVMVDVVDADTERCRRTNNKGKRHHDNT